MPVVDPMGMTVPPHNSDGVISDSFHTRHFSHVSIHNRYCENIIIRFWFHVFVPTPANRAGAGTAQQVQRIFTGTVIIPGDRQGPRFSIDSDSDWPGFRQKRSPSVFLCYGRGTTER